jgi:thiol-disulfide isomerase/thioredoxin
MIEVIKLGAAWCQPCKQYDPIFNSVKEKYDKEGSGISFSVIDIEDEANLELVQHYAVRSIPTTVFVVSGEIREKKIGVLDEKTISEIITSFN